MTLLLGYIGHDAENRRQIARALHLLAPTEPVRIVAREGAAFATTGGQIRETPDGVGALVGSLVAGDTVLADVAQTGMAPLHEARNDGHYALAWYDARTGSLLLAHDPFGALRLFYTTIGGTLWFSSALPALLALPPFSTKRQINLAALHTYLAFSFAAAPHTLIAGIQVVPPNAALRFDGPRATPVAHPLLSPRANQPPLPGADDETGWAQWLGEEFDDAMTRWSGGARDVAVHLSGGVDSAAVAAWLARAGARPHLFHLDFGAIPTTERPYAEQTAAWLGLPLVSIPVEPHAHDARRLLRQLVWQLGEPWGDPVTLPLMLGNGAVRRAGLRTLFNGEGGDQLFAGWPNRAMIAAALYGEADAPESRLHRYLQTFHHFYGAEDALYAPALRAAAATVDLRDYVRPFLEEPALPHLFDRLRWTNYWLKGSQNILPRAVALSRGAALEMRTPFFDRRLAERAMHIPATLLMRGTQEKYLLTRMLADARLLPPGILSRPKRGMGVPVTAWCFGPLRAETRHLLKRLARRGLFRTEYLRMLRQGQDEPGDLRWQRRVGEKIWQLCVLEIWLELFYDTISFRSPE